MLKCKKVRELIADYKCGLLNPDLSGLIEKHLDGCESCKQELKLYDAIDNTIKFIQNNNVTSPDIPLSLHKRLAGISQNRKNIIPFMFKPVFATAIIIAVIGGILALNMNTFISNKRGYSADTFIGSVICKAKMEYKNEILTNKISDVMDISKKGVSI